ncbi:unnamed protein product [Cylicocyclus nassatus]|uniref:Uncharacterized protein n=1 Tax=Cylicocyclus nassatus TaxID=53992 RepID=A0AA36H9L9_CYLNA|nr:unnamed protein product [Cylicocyclus nassatus]
MIRDSAGLASFLMQLEGDLLAGRTMSEIEAAAKIDKLRSTSDNYVDLRNGTTDVTHTVWISKDKTIPKEFTRDNTIVHKGHINLLGDPLDTLTRSPFWRSGLDFGHRTGYGVGYFLNMHEGPATIGYQQAAGGIQLWVREGMVLTIELGYCVEGKWGIRIENCYEVVEATVPSGADFLGFKTLTLIPIQTSLIGKSMLTNKEIEWRNAHHDTVLATTGDFLQKANKKQKQWND